MRIVFFCGHRSLLGMQGLNAILNSRFQVVAVVAADAPRWKTFGKKLNPIPEVGVRATIRSYVYSWRAKRKLRKTVSAHKTPLLWVNDANNPAFLNSLEKYKADIFLAAAYPQIFQQNWMETPGKEALGIHPSLLPAFAGAHPHFWAIRTGAKQTGITVHRIIQKVDRGEPLAQLGFPIDGMRYRQLYQKIGEELPTLIADLERVLIDGGDINVNTNGIEPSFFKNNQPEDVRIKWNKHKIAEINCILRTELAWCVYETKKLRISRGIVLSEHPDLDDSSPVGKILSDSKGEKWARCLDGWLRVDKCRWESGFSTPQIKAGERFA